MFKQFVVFDANGVDIPIAYHIVQAPFQSPNLSPGSSKAYAERLVCSPVCLLEPPGRNSRHPVLIPDGPLPRRGLDVGIFFFFQSSLSD